MQYKQLCFFILGLSAGICCMAQQKNSISTNTLLWKISGNGLKTPSYLFGTVHVLCEEDARLSSQAKKIIQDVHSIWFEADLDDAQEALGAIQQMNMKEGITLKSLLNTEEYAKVSAYFEKSGQAAVFDRMQNFKPLVLATLMQVKGLGCQNTTAMERVIMSEASKFGKEINGLETLASQLAIFDSIPYEVQAKQLLNVVSEEYDIHRETLKLMQAYKKQDLRTIDSITHDKKWGISAYQDILIDRRNADWLTKMEALMPQHPLLFAVGAGHLPGRQGLLRLLGEAGYTVSPLDNRN